VGNFFAAIAAIGELIKLAKEAFKLYKDIKARNEYKRSKKIEKELSEAIKNGDAKSIGDKLRKL